MKTSTCLTLTALLLAGFNAAAADAAKKPAAKTAAKAAAKSPAKSAAAKTIEAVAETTGTVKDNRVNIRGQATLNSEVVAQLKKGEAVTVLGEIAVPNAKKDEPAKWLKIALPANTPVWLNSQFLTNNTIIPNKLNFRAGPGENFSVLGRLEKGAAVKPLRTAGGWVEIETPPNAIAYVAADHVALKPAATEGFLVTNPVPPVPAPTPAPLVPPAPPETVKVTPAPALVITPIVPPPTTTSAPPPTATALPPIPSPIPAATVDSVTTTNASLAKLEPLPATNAAPALLPEATGPIVITPVTAKPKGWWERTFGPNEKKPSAKTAKVDPKKVAEPIDTEPAPPRLVTREGVVARAYNIQAPSDWELQELNTGRTINYLYSTVTNIPWKLLKGRTIIVTGEEAIDRRWPKTPLLKIEKLETLKTVE